MSITRPDAKDYLVGTYPELLTLAGIGTTDALTGVKAPIDRTMLKLGKPFANLAIAEATDEEAEGTMALLDYYFLAHVYKKVLQKRDPAIAGDGIKFEESKQVREIRRALAWAKEVAESYGYELGDRGDESGWVAGEIVGGWAGGTS